MKTSQSKPRVLCKECNGYGYTKKTGTEMHEETSGGVTRWFTHKQGSGCPTCLGVGYVE